MWFMATCTISILKTTGVRWNYEEPVEKNFFFKNNIDIITLKSPWNLALSFAIVDTLSFSLKPFAADLSEPVQQPFLH